MSQDTGETEQQAKRIRNIQVASRWEDERLNGFIPYLTPLLKARKLAAIAYLKGENQKDHEAIINFCNLRIKSLLAL